MATAQPSLVRRPIAYLTRSPSDPHRHIDFVVLILVIGLAGFGLVAIYTAKRQDLLVQGVDQYFYVKRQALALVIGSLVMTVAVLIDYRRLRDLAPLLYAGSLGLLAGVLVLGKRVNGAQAWFAFGPFQLQPSELSKVSLILMLASLATIVSTDRLRLRTLLVCLTALALPAGLTLLQPDFGTTSVLCIITMGTLLVAGARFKHIVVCTVVALAAVAFVLGTHQLKAYQQARLVTFLSQGNGTDSNSSSIRYQLDQSKTAIGNGGLYGQGFLNGIQTNGLHVPEQHTDFVFTAIAEQFGFIGAGALLFGYALLAIRILRTAQLAKDPLGRVICAGALSLLVWQVFQNVGMTMGIMPVTGIPLPLISYGGSATIAFLAVIGLVENVHMRRYT
jgi:rod shape determining protein RodA